MGTSVRPVLLAVIAALAGCADIDRDELRCEEAIAKVMSCCPGLAATPVACEHRPVGTLLWTFPNVECLVGRSCSDLTAGGICAWAAAPTTQVCP